MGIQALRGAGLGWVLWALGGAFVGIAGTGMAQAAPVPARLIDFLIESRAGRALSEQILGRELSAQGRLATRDLQELRLRIEAAEAESWRPELVRRLEGAQAELEASLQGRPRSLADRSRIVEEISSRALGTQSRAPGGRIEFLAVQPRGNFAATRAAMLGDPRSQALDLAIPVESGSMADRWGRELTVELAEIENQFFHVTGLETSEGIARSVRAARGGSSQDVNLQEMLDFVVTQRQQMTARYKRLADRYRKADKPLAALLDRTASEVNLTSRELMRIDARAPELSIVDYVDPQSAEPVMGYVARLVGQLGEIKVAVRLAGLRARGLNVEDLGRFLGEGKLADAARARLQALRLSHGRELGKELDLLMEDGWLWSEVKNYGKVFAPGSSSFRKVIRQAELTLDIRKLLENDPIIGRALKAAGMQIRLRSYFINGVTEEGAQALEKMGIEVFGTRYPDKALVLRDAA